MAINNKVKVPVIGAANKSILLNPQATEGAVFGKDLFFGDGSTVVTLQNLAAALGITNASAQPTILWNQLAAIPPNVIEVANLSTAGVVRRLPDGHWITQPPSDFIGRPGVPGRRGDRGPPGVPGSAGARGAGSIGIPGRRGPRGKQGIPGPPGAPGTSGSAGARGADGARVPGRQGLRGKQGIPGPPGVRGAAGPPGSASSGGSIFPGYRQKPAPRPRFRPNADPNASNVWSVYQRFLDPNKAIVLENASVPRIQWFKTNGGADQKKWQFYANTNNLSLTALNDAETAEHSVIAVSRGVGTAVTAITFGNATDSPIISVQGSLGVGTNAGFGKLAVASVDIAGLSVISAWDSRFTVFGPNVGSATGAALALGYDQTNDRGTIVSLAPNVAWKPLVLSGHTFSVLIDGNEAITINGAATTGTSQANMGGANNKPGTNNVTQAAKWLPVSFLGLQYYIPLFI